MRVVVLTNGSAHGAEILKALKAKDMPPSALIIERPRRDVLLSLRTSIQKYGYIETWFDVLEFVCRQLSRNGAAFPYANYAENVYSVVNFNEHDCIELLSRLQPDILVLGGSRMLKPDVLTTARVAVLNAHPGLLPNYRGVDVIPQAILKGDPIGVTVHQVDSGVDTGAIIAQQLVAIEPGDTILRLRRKAEIVAGCLVAQVI